MIDQSEPPTVMPVTAAHARRLFAGGVGVSAAYIIGLSGYAFCVRANMLAMTPDEFATFLSGLFAPLAFLWLVLGFRQQGDELQNSARALWLQGEELRNSVEQQRQLVEVSREQLAHDVTDRIRAQNEENRASQPRLLMLQSGSMYAGPERTINLFVNSGGPSCSNVEMLINGEVVAQVPVLLEGGRLEHKREYATPDLVQPLDVAVHYTDVRGNQRAQYFHVPVAENGGPNGDRTLGIPVSVRRADNFEPVTPDQR